MNALDNLLLQHSLERLLSESSDDRGINEAASMDTAIQNMEFLRQLIAESRQENPYADMAKLRMLQGSGMGTDGMTVRQEDE